MSSNPFIARAIRAKASLLSAFLLCAFAGLTWAGRAEAGGGPRNVVVVVNRNSSASSEIGRYYQQARGIPDANMCYIGCSTSETVTWQECETKIREPLRRFLADPKLANRIDYIVLTKGVPLKADYKHPLGPHSVASVLVWLDDIVEDANEDGTPDGVAEYGFPYGPLAYATWGFAPPSRAWSHTLFNSDVPGDPLDINRNYYLVTRLDAFTVEQVKSIIDRSACPAVDGVFVLDRNTWTTGSYKSANNRLGDQFMSAFNYLIEGGHEVFFDSGAGFIASMCGIMGYYSWAAHDSQYTYAKYVSNIFVPGSVGDTYYSSSARTFDDPGTTNRGSLIADLFGSGLCAAGGYVSEPYVTTATYANVLFDRYIQGYNAAESFYAACPQAFWKTAIAGDPLMAPYATPPQVSFGLPSTQLTGVITVPVNVSDESGVSKVELYINDDLVDTDTQAPFEIDLDSTLYPIGQHTIEAIAYENSPVATQGSSKLEVVIDNLISPEHKITDVLAHPDGQMVSVTSKIVTATPAETGSSFYIEEADRTSAIRVVGTGNAVRGDSVRVVGTMGSVNGERVMSNPTITVLGSAPVPKPLFVTLRSLGGASSGESTPAVGTNGGARNTALLVKVAGRVVEAGTGQFRISDGSLPEPTLVVCPGVTSPDEGTVIAVIGLSTVESVGSELRGAILVRNAADIHPL